MPATRRSTRLKKAPAAAVDSIETASAAIKKKSKAKNKPVAKSQQKAPTKAKSKSMAKSQKKAPTKAKRKTDSTEIKISPKKPKCTPPTTPPRSTSKASTVSPSPMKAAPKPKSHPVDTEISIQGQDPRAYNVVVAEDGTAYDVVLNQCNISSNNNKYYRLQLLSSGRGYYCWQKWGRVGEPGRASSSKLDGPYGSVAAALKPFLKKFRDKTGNRFGEAFVAKAGKYKLVEIENDIAPKETSLSKSLPIIEREPSKLDPTTIDLIHTLFSKEMRSDALQKMDIDLEKLPLGLPSSRQIAQGVSILERIQDKLKGERVSESYENLSSQFYTAIPHSFGRSIPPTIRDAEHLQRRFDMCNIMLDMQSTDATMQDIQKSVQNVTKAPALVDQHYDSLQASLALMDPSCPDFEKIKTYFDKTKWNPSTKLLNVWSVDRSGEAERFEKFENIGNRKLLWHGTNIAVVAPILTNGLRIMPHSGGRVGSGIYLANMQAKSAQYTSGYGAKYACMFLTEAPLGKEHIVNSDGYHASSLKDAPNGFDSVHAVGREAPEKWSSIEIEGNEVTIPQGPSKQTNKQSSFQHDEHLCYDEAQVRIRYIVTTKL